VVQVIRVSNDPQLAVRTTTLPMAEVLLLIITATVIAIIK